MKLEKNEMIRNLKGKLWELIKKKQKFKKIELIKTIEKSDKIHKVEYRPTGEPPL